MDDIVKQAMAKWPDVPSVYGWLGLNRRGQWLIKGDCISNPALTDFINRNYEHDATGCWFFQNGPQRVFVAIDYTPLIYRVRWDSDPKAPRRIEAHTGRVAHQVDSAWIDDAGVLLLVTEQGAGMMDDRDLDRLLPCFVDKVGAALAEETIAEMIESLQAGDQAGLYFCYGGHGVPVTTVAAADVPEKLGFVQRPVQSAGQEECF
jgi:hypothetical protein